MTEMISATNLDPVTHILRYINEHHGTSFALGERYPGGEHGAFSLTDGIECYVLKLRQADHPFQQHNERVIEVTELLRAVGYPASHYVLQGRVESLGLSYSVEDVLPGVPLGGRGMDACILRRLIELNALQRGKAVSEAKRWPDSLVQSVLQGGESLCLVESLRNYSATTAALLRTLQELVTRHIGEPAPQGDIVHFDFHSANILHEHGRVSGVIDWEGCRTGDAAFDLATLYFYADTAPQMVQQQLCAELVARIPLGLLRIYLAHLILRQVDWSIRFHDGATVARYVNRGNEVLNIAYP